MAGTAEVKVTVDEEVLRRIVQEEAQRVQAQIRAQMLFEVLDALRDDGVFGDWTRSAGRVENWVSRMDRLRVARFLAARFGAAAVDAAGRSGVGARTGSAETAEGESAGSEWEGNR